MTLNFADWIIISIVLVSCLFGLKRGLIKEALSVANWIVALLVALTYRDAMSVLLADHISNPSLRQTAAFVSLFAATLTVGALVNIIIGVFVRLSGLATTDRTLGLVFGFARGFVVVMVILISLSKVETVERGNWWTGSRLIPTFMAFEGWATQTSRESVAWIVQFLSVG